MPAKLITAAELEAVPGRCDLVRGKLRTMSPVGPHHGRVAARIIRLLGNHVDERGLGRVYANDTGFLLERAPDTVLGPNVALVHRDRLHLEPERGYFPGAPDLAVEVRAVEVRSPGDSRRQVREKAEALIACGCRLVLTVDLPRSTVTVQRPDVAPRTFGHGDCIDVGDVVMGLVLRVADIFAA
jgi:Uma2 family endonuclease